MPLINTMGGGSKRVFGGGGGGLFPFSTNIFTNALATGTAGPTLAQCQNAYYSAQNTWAVNSLFFNVVGGIQEFKIPLSGTYTFTLVGALGSYHSGNYPPYGASISGSISLIQGEVIKILIGQMGGTNNNAAGGGGGGSFVYFNATDSIPLIVAGGGGGQGQSGTDLTMASRLNLTSTGNGNPGNGSGSSTSSESTANGNGGSNGSAGVSGRISNSGAGWAENGRQTQSDCYAELSCAGRPGFAPRNGGAGGAGFTGNTACNSVYSNSQMFGGFGGGGGAGYAAGAGGGGYSGGGGASGCSYRGGGGGSFYNAARVSLGSSTQSGIEGHGFFRITAP